MKKLAGNYNRIVIKIGSSLLYANQAYSECFTYPMSEIAAQISDLIKDGKEIIVVSSGAIASGMSILKIKSRPRELSSLQAVAAVGQHLLMSQYRRFFDSKDLKCAQILLTWDDFNDRKRYLNAKNTLSTLLKLKIIPIINENDTVSTDEIKFGDNDRLSALVAVLINADLLIILSDVDGLLDKDKKVIRVVDKITPQIKEFALPTDKPACAGGMITKIEAAKITMDSGLPCVIANGRRKDIISSVIKEPRESGTLFIPKQSLTARRRWIAFSAKPKGKIIVDDGAREALLNKKSLLSVGIISCEGNFDTQDIISIRDKQNYEFARGKVKLGIRELDKVKGRRFDKEIIHSDDIVIL